MTGFKQDQTVIQKQFLYKQGGKDAVYYAGLIDAAHRKGVLHIDSTVVQFPTPENHMVAVCKAVVTMPPLEQGGPVRTFAGWGDCAPDNTKAHLLPHAIRMAETRSKARALRDALNIGDVAVEELIEQPGLPLPDLLRLADEWEADDVPWEKVRSLYTDNVIYLHKEQRQEARDFFARLKARRDQRTAAPPPDAPEPAHDGPAGELPATARQVKFIYAVAAEAKLDAQELAAWSQELYGQDVDHLNRRDAATLIEALQRRRNEVQ